MDCSLPGSSVHGFSRQEYWSGLLFPSLGDLPNPGIKPRSPVLQADSLLTELWGKPKEYDAYILICKNEKRNNQDKSRFHAQGSLASYSPWGHKRWTRLMNKPPPDISECSENNYTGYGDQNWMGGERLEDEMGSCTDFVQFDLRSIFPISLLWPVWSWGCQMCFPNSCGLHQWRHC